MPVSDPNRRGNGAARLPLLDSLRQDLRYALRTLRNDGGFTVFAVLIIALGIGASSTVFSVLNTLLVLPLPFKDPASLLWIANGTPEDNDLSGQTVQVNRLLALRERNKSFSDIAAYFAFYGVGDSKLTGSGEPERLSGVPVSQNFFPLLGIEPQIGRAFTADECKWNAQKVVLLSDGVWKRRFAGDPRIVGQAIRIDDADVTVVGVMPASFDFGSIFAPGAHIDLYTPFPLSDETNRWGNTLALVGRLKPRVNLATAQAEADVLGREITAEHPHENGLEPRLSFFHEHVSGRLRPALVVLAAAVAVVMLIVCANLSNLLLARTAARQKEMSIRTALGAGRGRLMRQLLTESLVLTSCGALLGIFVAVAATRGIIHLTAFNLPLLSNVRIDFAALGFALTAAIVTGVLMGMAPAVQVALIPLTASLSQRGGSESRRHRWMRNTLVVSEIAFACVLLVGAGLLIRSFLRVLDVNLGFRPERAATLRIDPGPQYRTLEQTNAYLDEALRRVRAIPGVDAAGVTDALPLGRNRTWGAPAKGQTYRPGEFPLAFVRLASDGYLKAMGIPLRAGRDFTERDAKNSTPVIIVNEALARRLWPGENPIGKIMLHTCGPDREVIGVAAGVRHLALEKESGSEMYLPMRQCNDTEGWQMVVRSRIPLEPLNRKVEESLRPIAPDLPRVNMDPLTDLIDRSVSPRRFVVLLLTGFAAFALVLASLSIYGVISYGVNRRTQEIGIRMALGAPLSDVQGKIVLQTLSLALLGLLAGTAVASGLARSLSSMLFGVTSGDPLTFTSAAAVLIALAALAGYLPARKAARIDPMIALRAE